MLRAIYGFIASDYYEPVNRLVLAWGLISIAMLVLGRARSGWPRIVAWAGIAALVASLLVSMVFEDFLPGLESGRTGVANAVGMALILAGTVVFALGGFVFVRATFGRVAQSAKPRFGRGRKGRPAAPVGIEPVPAADFAKVWLRPLAVLGGGFLLIALGASLNNENRFPFAWLWAPFGV